VPTTTTTLIDNLNSQIGSRTVVGEEVSTNSDFHLLYKRFVRIGRIVVVLSLKHSIKNIHCLN